jgi:hypothetical protein
MTVGIAYTAEEIGQISGSWTITGIGQAGAHDHSGLTGIEDQNINIGRSDYREPTASWPAHTHTILGDGLHIHGFSIDWRPSYIKFMEAKFD